MNDFVKDEETEATQSNDLKNNKTLLFIAKNIYEWEKKERQYVTHVIDDGGTRYSKQQQHDITSKTSPHLQLQHHDEDPMLLVDIGIQLLAKFLHRGKRIWSTCVEWRTHYEICSLPHTRTNVRLTTSQRPHI